MPSARFHRQLPAKAFPRRHFLWHHSALGCFAAALLVLSGRCFRARPARARTADLPLPAPQQPLTIEKAAATIGAYCPGFWLRAVVDAGMSLYRGEASSELMRLDTRPDLLDEETYGPEGLAYFQELDKALALKGPMLPRPQYGHLCGSAAAASVWGPACSIWPLGATSYAWPRTSSVFWSGRGPGAVAPDLVINEGLAAAIVEEREVLFQSSLGWFAVPQAYDRELRKMLPCSNQSCKL